MSVDVNFNETYKEAYRVSKKKGCTVPVLYRPYDTNRKTIDMTIWYASVESKINENISLCAVGETQEEALIDLIRKLLED